MLRLEKAKRSKEIILALYRGENFISPQLLQAFLIAFLLHAGGLLLFKIVPLGIEETASVHPYVQVGADLDLGKEKFATVEKEQEMEPLQMIPRRVKSPVFIYESPPLKSKPLSLMEDPTLPPPCIPLSLFTPKRPHCLAVKGKTYLSVAGPLKAKKILSSCLDVKTELTQDSSVHYCVKVEEKTGRIIWSEPQGFCGDRKIQDIAAQILKSLVFEHDDTGFIAEGEVEVEIRQ